MNKQVIEVLNKQVADWSVLFTKLHNFHWYVKGPQFFTLHEKFEELYTESATHIDEIAERILAIGGKTSSNNERVPRNIFYSRSSIRRNCRRDGRSNHERLRNDASRTEKRHGNRSKL